MNGPVNVRDLGGLPLAGGGCTRHGVLLRGDASYDGDEPPAGVAWPPATVIDLRSARERARSPYPWAAGTAVIHRELFDAGDLDQMPRHGALMDVYRTMVATAGPGIAGLVEVLGAEQDPGPTLVHCSAGKDRTGAGIAALLLLAGVPQDVVVTDYQLTAGNMEHVLTRLVARGAIDRNGWQSEWATAPAGAIALVVDELAAAPGGPRGWFLAQGASEAAIDRYLDRITAAA